MLSFIGPAELALALGLTFFAGAIKGVTGFAMPMVIVSGLGSFLSPELALAGLILPTLVTNIWQAVRQGWRNAWASAKTHWRFVTVSLVCLLISAQFVASIPGNLLFLILGVTVTFFAALQLAGWRPSLNPGNRRKAELGVGAFAGTLGGLSGIWGPPTVMYLTALNTPKTEHVRVQGVVYSTGAIALTLAHLNSGLLTGERFAFSALLVLPAVVGLLAGFWVQDHLNQDRFRWAILCVLTIAGVNLIRRGLVG
jgi:uncharacterized membrane protein YfcA